MKAEDYCMGCVEKRVQGSVCQYCGYQHDTPPESPLYLTPGTILHGKYLIGRVLGHGGFGITYLSLDLTLHVKLAVKEYLPRDMATRSFNMTTVTPYTGPSKEHFQYGLEKFLDEARALARFEDSPGIVSVKDFFQANETAYFVMNFVEGITFKEYLKSHGEKIDYDMALRILMPVMDALREVHQTGLLHRDISPDNIYITQDGRIKLLDFGAARYAAGEHSKSLSIMLKAGYAPEEQYRSKGKQGPWTDIYAVGATLYRTITGNVPLEALDRMDEDALEPPSWMGIKIPSHAEQALLKAMSVKAADRFQEMEMFQQALMMEPKKTVEPDGDIVKMLPGEMEVEDKKSFKKEDQKKRSHSAAKRKVIPALLIGLFALIAFSIFSKQESKQPPAPVPENKTLLSVASEMKGAAIYINNRYIGETDMIDKDIEPGTHVFTVKKEGYETYQKTITIKKGQKETLRVNLEKSAPAEPSSTLTVVTDPPNAKVRILNIEPIYQPGIELMPGRYHIEATANGYNNHKEWISIEPGVERLIKITLIKEKKKWKPGIAHEEYAHVVSSTTEGQWKPENGYTWIDKERSWKVKWKPGIAHEKYPHVVSSTTEGQWIPENGYTWVDKEKSWKVKLKVEFLEIIWNAYDLRYEGFMILKGNSGVFRVLCINSLGNVYDIVDQTVSARSVNDGLVFNCSNPISQAGNTYSADNFKLFNNGAIFMSDNSGVWSLEIVVHRINDENELKRMFRKYKIDG